MLVKMTEDWRRALDNWQVVVIAFIDFKKAFNSVSRDLLLQKLQRLGIDVATEAEYFSHFFILPVQARLDFYRKVFLPSFIYRAGCYMGIS